MKTSDAFKLIIKIENSVNTNKFSWKGFNTWPIIRQILWFKLTVNSSNEKVCQKKRISLLFNRIVSLALLIFRSFNKIKIKKDSEKIFFSRPVYLQEVNSKKFFDRIVDPIIESFDKNTKTSKYYVSKIPFNNELKHKFSYLHQNIYFSRVKISNDQKKILIKISDITNISSFELEQAYKNQLHLFARWFVSAKRLLSGHEKLKEIYVSSWYFPDMMGICAAASRLGIKTIDVQHGKQGKYQAMFSGWTKIPDEGYALMPDRFWCWGQPSCDHILASSPNRSTHIPFIGGYPWIDYYKKNITPVNSKFSDRKIRVLLTMQAPQGENTERIPDFIIDFLLSNQHENIHFTFRLHPNDNFGSYYLKDRLGAIDPKLFSIDEGKKNLYDVFMTITHHITAYSSCCYEASVFNIPTLLYGSDSKEIYKEDIENNTFTWINSNKEDLSVWLFSELLTDPINLHQYIQNK